MDADSRQNMEDTEVLKTAESVKTGESAETGESTQTAESAETGESTEKAASKIQWHPGFRGAFQREFRKYRESLHFEEELPLTVSSLFVDLLVIIRIQPVSMENDLGKIFRKVNICEYKGPDDALTMLDYYKTVAYANLYLCAGPETGAVSAGEITLSLIRDAYPRSLMRSLEEARFTVTERYPGIYYLGRPGDEEGDEGLKFPYPTQIVVTGRLKPETHSGLRILRRPADRADILRFLEEARRESEPVDVRNVNAILGASVPANADLYARIRRESDMLYPALKELMKEDLEERWNAGLQRGERLGLEKGERLGLEKGERLGLQKGIIGAVGIYRDELGLDDRTITDKIAKRFQLTNEQAARYISAQGM